MTTKLIFLAAQVKSSREDIFQADLSSFRGVAAALRAVGYEVWSPAEHAAAGIAKSWQPATPEGRAFMAVNLQVICERATWVVTLDGWEHSERARAEVAVAKTMELPVLTVGTACVRAMFSYTPSNEPFEID